MNKQRILGMSLAAVLSLGMLAAPGFANAQRYRRSHSTRSEDQHRTNAEVLAAGALILSNDNPSLATIAGLGALYETAQMQNSIDQRHDRQGYYNGGYYDSGRRWHRGTIPYSGGYYDPRGSWHRYGSYNGGNYNGGYYNDGGYYDQYGGYHRYNNGDRDDYRRGNDRDDWNRGGDRDDWNRDRDDRDRDRDRRGNDGWYDSVTHNGRRSRNDGWYGSVIRNGHNNDRDRNRDRDDRNRDRNHDNNRHRDRDGDGD